MATGIPQFASLYVGDLHADVTEAMLYEIFNSVGQVASIRVCRDSVSRRSLGYGYVNFHSVSDAERALDALNYSSIKGRSCRIMWSQRDPSMRKSGAGNIYVKNLDKNIDNKALYDTFSLFGSILSCKVASDPNGKSYGYGFVHYETEDAAKQAIERVNGMQIGEKTVQAFPVVSEFMKRNERPEDKTPDHTNYTNLYVKGLPAGYGDEKLSEMFSEYGKISSTAVRADNKGRNFAFVAFENTDDAKKAVEALHKKDMRTEEQKAKDEEDGKEPDEVDATGHPVHLLYVQRAQTKAERQAELREKYGTPSGDGKQQGVNLFVKNLDDSTDEAALKELFEPFGSVTSAATPKDEKGRSKGFGFVCFASPDEATKAVTEMHLKVIAGKPLYVGLAEKRDARQERLRQRYNASSGMGKGGKPDGGKGGGKGGGMPAQGGFFPQGSMPPQMMGFGPQMGMMARPGMMGPRGPMMGGPQMMMGPRGPMMAPPMMMSMMGKGAPMMGKGMAGVMPMGGMPGFMRPPMPMQAVPGARPAGVPVAGVPGQSAATPTAGAPAAPTPAGTPLTASALAAAEPAVQKQMIGEQLYPAIARYQPELAGKITGMMLEMDNSELLLLLESDQQLRVKVDEALRVLGNK